METTPGTDGQPGIAIIVPGIAPYRTHLHRRLANGIPEYRLHTPVLYQSVLFNSADPPPPQINLVSFVQEGTINHSSWYRGVRGQFRKARRIADYIEAHNIRAVVLHGYSDLTRLWLLRYCRRRGIAVMIRADSNVKADRLLTPVKQWFKHRFIGWIVRQCDAVLPVGTLGEQFFQKYGVPPERCFRVTFEPDYERISSVTADEVDAFRAAHEIPSDRRHILYSGRLIPLKRIDMLIDAFTRIADDRPQWDVMIVGDGELRGELEARVPEHLVHRFRWLGRQEFEVLRVAYHAAHINVLLSWRDAWGLVINEAMAAGLPIVATDVCGAPWDLVRDRGCGRLIPSGDEDALVEALLEVTDADNYERYRAVVGPTLERWRAENDPVAGMRAALRFLGLLPATNHDEAAPG